MSRAISKKDLNALFRLFKSMAAECRETYKGIEWESGRFPDISDKKLKKYLKRERLSCEEIAALSMGKDPEFLNRETADIVKKEVYYSQFLH